MILATVFKMIIATLNGLLGILICFQSSEEKGATKKMLQFLAMLMLITVVAICI